jgi:single-strand DNA-binding protein
MLGNLTSDPELTYLPSQTPVVNFTLATNYKYKGADGQEKQEACFIECKTFGKRAEVISKFCSKGSPLMIEGRLQLDKWEAQDGTKRSKHRITVLEFTFVGKGQQEQTQEQPKVVSGFAEEDIPF